MPKFLDAPSWYTSNGYEVHGLGSSSSSGFPGNIPEGLVLGLPTIEGASNNGVEGQTYLLPLTPSVTTPTIVNQYKGGVPVIAGEASYNPGTGTIYMPTQPVYRQLYHTMILFKIANAASVYIMETIAWEKYGYTPKDNYTMAQWVTDYNVPNYFIAPYRCDNATTQGAGLYASIENNQLKLYKYSGEGYSFVPLMTYSTSNVIMLQATSNLLYGL